MPARYACSSTASTVEVRERGRALLSSPEFAPVSGLTRAQYREQVHVGAQRLAQEGHTALGFPTEFGGAGDIGGSVVAFEMLAHGDRFAALKADTDVCTTFEGDNTVLLQLVAKSLLTNYSEQFSDLNPLGTARFVTGQLVEAFVERSAARQVVGALREVVPRRDDHGGLHDPVLNLDLFRWREEAFVRAVNRCEDGALAVTLDRLCDLYALHEIERDRGWFLEHGRLTGARSKAITKGSESALRRGAPPGRPRSHLARHAPTPPA